MDHYNQDIFRNFPSFGLEMAIKGSFTQWHWGWTTWDVHPGAAVAQDISDGNTAASCSVQENRCLLPSFPSAGL